jgi:hypothetical protein
MESDIWLDAMGWFEALRETLPKVASMEDAQHQ